MATITSYQLPWLYQFDGTAPVDFNTDTIKLALATSAYSPSATTHDYFNDITNEVTGTGYTAGGATLASLSCTQSAGTVTFDAADVTFAQNAAGFTNARYAILYKSTGTAATSPLIGYIDLTTDRSSVAGDIIFTWNAAGIFTCTAG